MIQETLYNDIQTAIDNDWDSFIDSSFMGNIHQKIIWARAQQNIKGRSTIRFYRYTKDGIIIAQALIIQMNTGFMNMYWWYCPRGVVYSNTSTNDDKKRVLEMLTKSLSHTHGIYFKYDIPLSKDDYKAINYTSEDSLKDYQPTDTLLIDTTKTENDILMDMKRKGRYNIKLAEEKGVIITMYSGKDTPIDTINAFIELQKETNNRNNFVSHNDIYYHNFINILDKHCTLWTAYDSTNTHLIASAILVIDNNKAIYYFGASTSDAQLRSTMGAYLLQWRMIQYAKTMNCTTYDFLGIAPEGTINHPYSGITEFKMKFGGYRCTYINTQQRILRPVLYSIYKALRYIKSKL